jgi:hypothetical protein
MPSPFIMLPFCANNMPLVSAETAPTAIAFKVFIHLLIESESHRNRSRRARTDLQLRFNLLATSRRERHIARSKQLRRVHAYCGPRCGRCLYDSALLVNLSDLKGAATPAYFADRPQSQTSKKPVEGASSIRRHRNSHPWKTAYCVAPNCLSLRVATSGFDVDIEL